MNILIYQHFISAIKNAEWDKNCDILAKSHPNEYKKTLCEVERDIFKNAQKPYLIASKKIGRLCKELSLSA